MRTPVTIVMFAAMAALLQGCLAYDAASTVVGAGTSVIGAAGSAVGAAGDVVTSPFDRDEKNNAR